MPIHEHTTMGKKKREKYTILEIYSFVKSFLNQLTLILFEFYQQFSTNYLLFLGFFYRESKRTTSRFCTLSEKKE